jgi:DNA anti-recombination protein RmuC
VRQAMDNFTFAQTTSEVLELHGVFNREWKKFKGAFDGIKENIDSLQEAFETLSTTRRRKLDGVLDKIDELRGPERSVTAELPSTASVPLH